MSAQTPIPHYQPYRAIWLLGGGFKIEGKVDAVSARDAAHLALHQLISLHPQWSGIGLPTVRPVSKQER